MSKKGTYRMKFSILVTIFFLITLNSFTQIINLSANGTANSYIVVNEGKYSFLPVKGNSKFSMDNLVSVDWLWMTEKNLIKDVKYTDGEITFTAGRGKGNAVIVAFDEKDKVIWSWHIWLTDDPTKNLHYVGSIKGKIMDRNLGATSTNVDDVSSYGLYYQWGRKDPFIGALVPGSTDNTVRRENIPFTEGTATVRFNRDFSDYEFKAIQNTDPQIILVGGSVAFSIGNPTTFISFKETVNNSPEGSWFNAPLEDYLDNLWGYQKRKTTSKKTIFDPCPPGYKVPSSSGDIWRGIESGEHKGKLNGYVYWFDGKEYYYPPAGSRRQTNGRIQYTGYNSGYWSATPRLDNAIYLIIDEKGVVNDAKAPRAMGLSVRCVCEE